MRKEGRGKEYQAEGQMNIKMTLANTTEEVTWKAGVASSRLIYP